MNKNYEILETFEKDNQIWSFARHKSTGLEIAYHKCETSETGFSFCFKTPVEDPYLGTSHVLEHCIVQGSDKYKVPVDSLRDLAFYSYYRCSTSYYSTCFGFYSLYADECYKLIPIIADYVFFPELSEEAFMQECIRVELDSKGDSRKNTLVGVVYNEVRFDKRDNITAGLYYKLHELTNEKIKDYHERYYRPDNCLFSYNGNEELDDVLLIVDKFVADLEKVYTPANINQRTTFTIQEVMDNIPLESTSEEPGNPDLTHWLFGPADEFTGINMLDPCCQLEQYWLFNLSPLLPFRCDEKWAYSIHNYINNKFEIIEPESVPENKSAKKIISEYLRNFTKEEYKQKLEKLHQWQARDFRAEALKIMAPLFFEEYDVPLPSTEERIKTLGRCQKSLITYRNQNYPEFSTFIEKHTCSIRLRPSAEFSQKFYAEFAVIIYLKHYMYKKFRQLGIVYDVKYLYQSPDYFTIKTQNDNNPEKTILLMKEIVVETAEHIFSAEDLLELKSRIHFKKNGERGISYISSDIFNLTTEDLHKAAVRFKKMICGEKKGLSYTYNQH